MWKSNTLIFQKLHIYMHKKYQEKWKNAYFSAKMFDPPPRPDPGSATVIVLKVEMVKFLLHFLNVKMNTSHEDLLSLSNLLFY